MDPARYTDAGGVSEEGHGGRKCAKRGEGAVDRWLCASCGGAWQNLPTLNRCKGRKDYRMDSPHVPLPMFRSQLFLQINSGENPVSTRLAV